MEHLVWNPHCLFFSLEHLKSSAQWCTTWIFVRSRHIWDIFKSSWTTIPIHHNIFFLNQHTTNTPRHFFKELNTPPKHHNILKNNLTHHRDDIEKFYRKTYNIWFIRHIWEKCRDKKVCILPNYGKFMSN